MNPLDEAVERVMAGDAAAFQQIVEATADALVRLSARILGRVDEAEDAVQEAYLKAFRALQAGQFDRRSSVRTWLYRIVTNTSLDARRSRRGQTLDEPLALEAVDVGGAEARLSLRELADWLSVLPEEQRVALVLSAVEGMSSAEIGEVMGCSEGAVEQRLVRARATLRRRRGEG